MFLFGPPNIEKLKTSRNVPGLVKAMGYKKESSDAGAVEVRRQAAAALGEIGDAAGIDVLIVALHDVHEKVREAAKQALTKINDPRAAKPFVDMWMGGTESERVAHHRDIGKDGPAGCAGIDLHAEPQQPGDP